MPGDARPDTSAPAADPQEPNQPGTESLVGIPRRRRVSAPLPLAVRRGGPVRWTPVGTIDSGVVARVDPAGLVQLEGRPWTLDWWVRSEQRWHHPSMDATVDQRSDGDTPVLATTLRVPGGEVTHRCAGAQLRSRGWNGPGALVEVHNDSAVPVAVALVLRPHVLDGPGRIDSVALSGPEEPGADAGSRGFMVSVNESDAVVFEKLPSRGASGDPDTVHALLASGGDEALDDLEGFLGGVPGGSAPGSGEVAFVFPLSHTSRLRVALAPVERRTSGGLRRRARPARPELPVRLPTAAAVRSGWEAHGDGEAAMEWASEVGDRFTRWSAAMLALAASDEVTACLDPQREHPGATAGVRLDELGRALAGLAAGELHDAAFAALVHAQRFSGLVEPVPGEDATAGLLWLGAALLGAPTRERHAPEVVGPVAKALRHLERRDDPPGTGRAGTGPALRRLAVGLSLVGQPDVARWALALAEASGAAGRPGQDRGGDDGRVSLLAPVQPPDRAKVLVESMAACMPGARDTPGARHEASETGGREGFDIWRVAALRNELLESVVADTAPGPDLLGMWREHWNGRPVEVHRVPTSWGVVSAGLRWHGERAALLWDIAPWAGSTGGEVVPVVTASGLAPGWSAAGWSGEALLDPNGQ